MRIISYNVNGIRAAIKKGFIDWLKTNPADVICLQEIKAEHSDIDVKQLEALGELDNTLVVGHFGIGIFEFVSEGGFTCPRLAQYQYPCLKQAYLGFVEVFEYRRWPFFNGRDQSFVEGTVFD